LALIGVLAIIFMETGLLIGLVYSSQEAQLVFFAGVGCIGCWLPRVFDGEAKLSSTLTLFTLAARWPQLSAAKTGYWIRRRNTAVKLFERPDGRFFNQKKGSSNC
jgi:membrane-associated protein